MQHVDLKSAIRCGFVVEGQVQGVGFRPFVYRLALEHGLCGFVRNTPEGVRIEVQGRSDAVEGFADGLRTQAPPLARIQALRREALPCAPEPDMAGFRILHSTGGQGHNVLISPDTATCDDCQEDIFDPANRRFHYPFTNCTNCGPRYTITRTIPYDRPSTSMACFPLCEACAREYADPLDRRFHAQPNACPVCGPQLWLSGPDGREIARAEAATEAAAKALAAGEIVAVKGLGGFHLACLATGETGAVAVARLRERKLRPHKPLAVMVPDLAVAAELVELSDEEAGLLSGPQRPIALCKARHSVHPASALPPGLAPDTPFIGLMLPYTPLHHLLLRALREALPQEALPALVMTSGNRSSEPICLGNREALQRLSGLADLFLLHNRDILIRNDDSVLRLDPDTRTPLFLRRARGYVPGPVRLASAGPPVLALGPELKNTLCLTKGDQAFVSQHVGNMENLETYAFFQELIEHLQRILATRPEALVHDLHPDYLSTRYAREQTALPTLALQHHVAHIHAVLAEHRHLGPAIGLALDGTGLGDDGTLWGGECLFVDTDTLEHRRMGRFRLLPLPGGEAAIREPWRIAQAALWRLGRTAPTRRPWPWLAEHERSSALLPQLLEKRLRTPLSSSCGRLFDAVAALLGLATTISYEGQAAIRLESIQDMGERTAYACPLRRDTETVVLDTLVLFEQVADDWEREVPASSISRRFHLGLMQGLVDLATDAADKSTVRTVGLSGGAMQNLTLHRELPARLAARGLTPLCHAYLPPNDGCIALGQAAWAARRLGR